MKVFHNPDEVIGIGFPTVITLGNFDAIHLGHQEILKRCILEARRIQGKSMVVTYDHQHGVLHKGHPEYVYLNNERTEIFRNLGLDYMVLIPFTEEIRNISAHDFLHEIILKKLNARVIVIGYDHHFGKNRQGNYDYLKQQAKLLNFDVIQIPPVYHDQRIISSSRIRSDLVMGEISKANSQLAMPFHLYGKVVHGYHRGEITGYPTANIQFSKMKIIPADGVYLGEVELNGKKFPCAMNIGNNPTFNNDHLSIEVHILDFHENLYGETITLFFYEKIRNEIKFESVEALKKQIALDIDFAKKYFNL